VKSEFKFVQKLTLSQCLVYSSGIVLMRDDLGM
jgi:hypothetical protein